MQRAPWRVQCGPTLAVVMPWSVARKTLKVIGVTGATQGSARLAAWRLGRAAAQQRRSTWLRNRWITGISSSHGEASDLDGSTSLALPAKPSGIWV